MNIIGETWSYKLLRCLASDRKSTPKFHYTMLLIWSGEIYYTNIVVSRLFFLRWEVMMYFTAFSFGYTATRLIKADHEAAEHFVCHRGLSTNHRRDERFRKLAIFVCWLAPRYILLLLTYFDANSDYWRLRSSHKTTFQQSLIFVLLTSYWLLDCNVASNNLVLPPKINISINCSVLCLNNILALFVFYSKPNNTL